MDESLWITGILVAISAFAVKAGLAASSILYNREFSIIRRLRFLSAIIFSYVILFLIIFTATALLPVQSLVEKLIGILNYGMTIHLVIALGMFIWGISLLRKRSGRSTTRVQIGALYLSLPCPVCALVIFITVSMTHSILSIPMVLSSLLLFGIFLSIILITIISLLPLRRRIEESGVDFLGMAMVIIALYFVLTVLIAPVYQEAKDVFQLVSTIPIQDSIDLRSLLVLIISSITLFSFGFLRRYFKEKGILEIRSLAIGLFQRIKTAKESDSM